MKTMKTIRSALCIVALASAAGIAYSQEQKDSNPTVTLPKAQYQKLVEEHQRLIEEMKEIKAFKARMEEAAKKAAPQQAETEQALDDLEKELKAVRKIAKESFPGSTKMLLAGYGAAGFNAQDNAGSRGFYATFNPILLWKLSDRLLFEVELEAQLAGTDTHIVLEIAQASYVLNDYMTLGAGKFLSPMNYFVERQHMAWVNKLPDKPLAVYDGLLPEANVGFQLRGGFPVGPTKFGYSIFVANAPLLQTDAVKALSDLGKLEFDNFDNVGQHIAYGGRLGFQPIPELEVGYGMQFSDVTPPGAPAHVSAFLQSADLSYVRDSAFLKGVVNLKAQWVWSKIDPFTYDPTSLNGGPYFFRNRRNGGYAQVAYRPSRLENPFFKNLEPVFRFDLLKQKNTPVGFDESRYTVGLNYWLGPSTVIKAAYEFDQQKGPNANYHNVIQVQFATGF